MSCRKDLEEYHDELRGAGWTVEKKGSGNWRMTHIKSGKFISTSATPSDRNVIHKVKAEVRRLLREVGELPPGGQEGEYREKRSVMSGIRSEKVYNMKTDTDPWPNLPHEFEIKFVLQKENAHMEVWLPEEFDSLGLWLEGELGRRRLVVNTTAGGNKGVIDGKCCIHVGKPPLLDGISRIFTMRTRRSRAWILIGDTIERLAEEARPTPHFERPPAATLGDILGAALKKKEEEQKQQPKTHVMEPWKFKGEEKEEDKTMAKTKNYQRATMDNFYRWGKLASKSDAQVCAALGYSDTAHNEWFKKGEMPLVADNCIKAWIRVMELEKEVAELKKPKEEVSPAPVEGTTPLDFIKQGLSFLNTAIKNKGLTAFIKDDGTIGAKVVTTVEL